MSEDGRWDARGQPQPLDAETLEEGIEAMKKQTAWPPRPAYTCRIGDEETVRRVFVGEGEEEPE